MKRIGLFFAMLIIISTVSATGMIQIAPVEIPSWSALPEPTTSLAPEKPVESPTATLETNILSGNNHNPVVSVGEDLIINSTETKVLNLTVYDPDGDKVTISYYGQNGKTYGKNGTAYFEAVETYTQRIGKITVIVKDNKGGTGSDSVKVTILPLPKPTPTPTVTPTVVPTVSPTVTPTPPWNTNPTVRITGTEVVTAGDLITVSATASDPDGQIDSYSWYASEGAISAPSGQTTTVTSPTGIEAVRRMVVIVTVTDDKGGSSSDALEVQVTPRGLNNNDPIINELRDITISPGASIYITPYCSDPDGDTMTYQWYCTGGNINNLVSKDITFTAPSSSSSGTTVICSLIAADGKGGSATRPLRIKIE